MSDESLILFPNVHMVMKADRLCRAQGVIGKAIPVPEYISSECGMCLLIKTTDLAVCKAAFDQHKIPYSIE